MATKRISVDGNKVALQTVAFEALARDDPIALMATEMADLYFVSFFPLFSPAMAGPAVTPPPFEPQEKEL